MKGHSVKILNIVLFLLYKLQLLLRVIDQCCKLLLGLHTDAVAELFIDLGSDCHGAESIQKQGCGPDRKAGGSDGFQADITE